MWSQETALVLAALAGVVAAPATPGDDLALRRADVHRPRVRIVAPTAGAVVWDRFAVGVELSPAVPADVDLVLELSDGTRLEAERTAASPDGTRRATFAVDAAALEPGPFELRAFGARPGAVPLASDPVGLVAAHPEPDAVFAGECEATVATERPEGFGSELPRVGSRADASGGEYVANPATEPLWLVPFDVPASGRYQMIVVARGDLAGGAFPSIGLCVDAPGDLRTSVRLVDRTWQRLAVGQPVELEAGRRHLAVRFLNDFHLPNTADRNLYLDRFEILRVEEAGTTSGYGAMAVMSAMRGMDGGTPDDVRVGLRRALDGLPVNGRLQIEGVCRWVGMESSPAPRVELVLNRRVVAEQQATRALFAIDRSQLVPGPNTIRLVATLPDGRRGATPEEVVHVEGELRPSRPPRDLFRFTVVDERWDDALRGTLSGLGEEPGHQVAELGELGEPGIVRLALPEELEGAFDVVLEARGPGSPLAALALVSLETAAGAQPLEQVRIQNWWRLYNVGAVTLERGPKSFALTLADESHRATRDEEKLLVRSLMLRTETPEPDRGAPRATVLYPPPGHVAHALDAVVVAAADDDDRLASADVWIDGVPQRVGARLPDGVGWLVLPLLLRDVPPGDHALSVRVEDAAGNVGESLEVPFTVAAEPPAALGPYARAVRLTSRFAYGPEPQQLAAVLLEGERAWLETQLAERGAGDLSARAFALAEMRDVYDYGVTRAAIQHSLGTRNPVWTRAAWWAENHFSTWIRKSGGGMEWGEHETFLRLGPARFVELLTASATSPAMLVYLDQRQSYAGRPNENYAREIMELHTLGVDGGYGQEDVRELAALLAGLTLAEEAPLSGVGSVLALEFRYAPELADGAAHELLGTRFEAAAPAERWQRLEETLALLASHPSTARHVARSLAEHYVAVPPPDDLVGDLARVFTETDGDLSALLLAIAEHEAFLDPKLPLRATTPMDYAFRLARASGVPEAHWAVHGYLQRAGMACFDRATPDGYPEEDAAWTDTNATMQRWSLPREVAWAAHRLAPDALRAGSAGDAAAWRQRVVDVIAVRLTGRLLGEASNRAALEYFDSLEGPTWEQVNEMAVLLCQMPEAALE